MRSYTVAIAFAVLVSAVFSYQNPGEVTIRFLVWTRQLPQGVWEVAVFSAGCVLMWIVSLSAHLEGRVRFRKIIREQTERISKLEEDRATILKAIRTTPDVLDRAYVMEKENNGGCNETNMRSQETVDPIEPLEKTETEENASFPEKQGD